MHQCSVGPWTWSCAVACALCIAPVSGLAQPATAPAQEDLSSPAPAAAAQPSPGLPPPPPATASTPAADPADPSSSPAVEPTAPSSSSPAVEPAAPPAPLPAPAVASQRRAPLLSPPALLATTLVTGAAMSVLVVPTALVGGAFVGSLPPNLVAAIVPALAIALLLPPLAVAGNETAVQGWLGDGAGSFWWAWGTTSAVHVVTLATAALLGASTTNPLKLGLLVGVEAVLLPATATATLWLTAPGDADAR